MHAFARPVVFFALLAGLSTTPALAQPGQQGPPPAAVVVEAARLETVEQWREVTGSLRALRRSLLASQEEGLVVALDLDEGDEVKAGQVLARLHDVRAKIEVARTRAELADRQATVNERTSALQTAERDWARYQKASDEATVTPMEMDRIQSNLDVASARLEAAKAGLEAAQADLDLAAQRLSDMAITAPFDGRVVSKQTQVGQWIGRGDAVVEIVALDIVEAWLDVPEGFVGRLAESGTVQVRCAAVGRTYEAKVTAVIPDADPLSKLFPVRVRLENKDLVLRPGMSIVGVVPTGSSAATLTVSKDAILRNDAGEFVYFNAGGVAAIAPVSTLFGLPGNRVAIRSEALPPGAAVISEGNERLFPGQPLAVAGEAPAGAGGPPGGPEGAKEGGAGGGSSGKGD
jgi:RND family efflux transporter MFP subunit